MNIELVNRIKRITLIAMASDDELVETLVLKGGNAIELAYFSTASKISRTSYDLDYSIENGDFTEPEEEIALRLKSTLERTFMEHGFVVIDFKFFSRPHYPQIETADFWGGYKVEFKVVEKVNYESNSTNIDKMRRSSVVINPNNSPILNWNLVSSNLLVKKRQSN
ncbi:MAG: nucleotidyl transferase AbiEii/AbiGii toxin family protein [Bacteroidetes bacterium]|nr:nucleotidyl transferase AbiEii/AbiGii toxin family protein [Bacteroidota bacterium]